MANAADELRYAREQNSPFSWLYDYINSQRADLASEGRRPVLGGLLSKEPVQGIDTLRYEGLMPLLASLLDPVARGVDAPAAAYAGTIPQEDLLGEALGTAGTAVLGGGAASAPADALRSGLARRNPDVEAMFPEDVYHYTRGQGEARIEGDVFDRSRGYSRFDRLGPHVGSRKAAQDRGEAFYGQSEDLAIKLLNSKAADDPFYSDAVMWLKARTDRPFLGEGGVPLSEDGVREVMLRYADQNKIADLDVAAEMFRKDLTDAGFTHIPYINNLEDRGNPSYIMLTGRTAGDPEVLRGKFAAFQDPYSESLMAANKSKATGAAAVAAAQGEAKAPALNKLDPDAWKTRLLTSIPAKWLHQKYDQPQWHGISEVASKLPEEAMAPKFRDTGTLVPERVLQIEDFVGRKATPAYGDRSVAGVDITGIGDLTYDDVIRSLGGADFMRENATGIWANAGPQAEQLAGTVAQTIREGGDPALMFTAMAPQSGDFSTMMARAVMNQYDPDKIPLDLADQYDAAVRAAVPKFSSIKNPDFLEGLKGTDRWNLWQLMDRANYRDAGFPDINLARRSITDPRLLDAVPFDTGMTVGRPTGGLLQNHDYITAHPTYPAQLAGDYEGGLGNIAGPLIWRDFFEKRREAGIPSAGDQKSFMGSAGLMRQDIDQQTVDEVRQFQEMLQNLDDPTSPFRLWQR